MVSDIDELTIGCSGAGLPNIDNSREDYLDFITSPAPSSYQVARESDGSYLKGDAISTVNVAVSFDFFF